MKNIDLTKQEHSLSEVLELAKSESVLIHTTSGEDFVLEFADEFDREAAALGGSGNLQSFLEARSKETGDISLNDIRNKRKC